MRGVGSRRACDALIESGVVRVNGSVVREPGRRVEPDRDQVVVRGRPLPGRSALRYFAVHKPVGMITTLHDPEGRATVRDLLPPGPRLFPVGRLDADTSGLLIVTNDGDLAHKLMHPRYGVEKRYKVLVDEVPDSSQLTRLRSGVTLEPGVRTGPADVRLSRAQRERPTLDIRIHEGRYRQVRRMCEAVGLRVKALHRYGYGPLQIGLLPRGAVRPLSEAEVRRLRAVSARPGGTAPPLRRARTERPSHTERSPRTERPLRTERSPRTERTPRSQRSPRTERTPRSQRSPRTERPSRNERPSRAGRSSRTERSPRAERSRRTERPPRAGRGRPMGQRAERSGFRGSRQGRSGPRRSQRGGRG